MQEKDAMICICNEDGEIINYKKRSEVNKKIEILKQINIIVINDQNEIFMTKPKDTVYKESYGSSASGLLRKDETIEECAERTLKRELNIDLKLKLLSEKYYNFNGVKRIMSVFYYKGNSNPMINANDVYEGKWININEVEKLIKENNTMPSFNAAFEIVKNRLR